MSRPKSLDEIYIKCKNLFKDFNESSYLKINNPQDIGENYFETLAANNLRRMIFTDYTNPIGTTIFLLNNI